MAPGVPPQKSFMSESLGHEVHSLHAGALTPPLPHAGASNTLIVAHIRPHRLSAAGPVGKNFPLTVSGLQESE